MLVGQSLNRNRVVSDMTYLYTKCLLGKKVREKFLEDTSTDRCQSSQSEDGWSREEWNPLTWQDEPCVTSIVFLPKLKSWLNFHQFKLGSSVWTNRPKIWQMPRFWDSRNDGGAGQTADHRDRSTQEGNMILVDFVFAVILVAFLKLEVWRLHDRIYELKHNNFDDSCL